MILTRSLVIQKACKLKTNIVVCDQFDPTSKDLDSQGMPASRAAHFPHILRASRQVTAAARQNAACRRVFCALVTSMTSSNE